MQSDEHRDRLLALRERTAGHRPGRRDAGRRDGGGRTWRAREFRASVRDWCRAHVPAGLAAGADRRRPTTEFVRFQRAWFAELRQAGYAVPHWPREWGGGMSAAEQVVLYSELAAHDAPRLVLAFVGDPPRRVDPARRRAPASSAAPPPGHPRRRDLGPGLLRARGRVRSGQPADRPRARRATATSSTGRSCGPAAPCTPTGACCWPAPTRQRRNGGASPTSCSTCAAPGIDVRPIRQATGESHFCEIFLDRRASIPATQLVGPENAGWRVAQETLGAERGMTMLELAERLGHAGFRWLLETRCRPGPGGGRPLDDDAVAGPAGGDSRPRSPACARCAASWSSGTTPAAAGPADASIVKLYYSELLQRMTDFGAEVGGLAGPHRAGQAGLERLGVGRLGARLHRLLGVDDPRRDQRDPAHHHRRARPRAAPGTGGGLMQTTWPRSAEELRAVARDLLSRAGSGRAAGVAAPAARAPTGGCWPKPAGSGWRCRPSSTARTPRSPRSRDRAGAGPGRRAAARTWAQSSSASVRSTCSNQTPAVTSCCARSRPVPAVPAAALASGEDPTAPEDLPVTAEPAPFRLERTARGLRLHGRAAFVPDAARRQPAPAAGHATPAELR